MVTEAQEHIFTTGRNGREQHGFIKASYTSYDGKVRRYKFVLDGFQSQSGEMTMFYEGNKHNYTVLRVCFFANAVEAVFITMFQPLYTFRLSLKRLAHACKDTSKAPASKLTWGPGHPRGLSKRQPVTGAS